METSYTSPPPKLTPRVDGFVPRIRILHEAFPSFSSNETWLLTDMALNLKAVYLTFIAFSHFTLLFKTHLPHTLVSSLWSQLQPRPGSFFSSSSPSTSYMPSSSLCAPNLPVHWAQISCQLLQNVCSNFLMPFTLQELFFLHLLKVQKDLHLVDAVICQRLCRRMEKGRIRQLLEQRVLHFMIVWRQNKSFFLNLYKRQEYQLLRTVAHLQILIYREKSPKWKVRFSQDVNH